MSLRERIARMSLRNRIAAVAGLAVAIAFVAGAVAVYFAVRSELRGEVDTALRDRGRVLARGPGPGDGRPGDRRPPDAVGNGRGAGFPGPPPDDVDPRRLGGAAGFVQLVTPAGRASVGNRISALRLPVDGATRSIARRGTGEHLSEAHVGGVHLRILAVGTGPRGAVQVARPLDEADDVLRRIALILVIIVLAGSALALALGAVVARSALAPIGRFTRRTEDIAADSDPSRRMEVVGTDELARLAVSFNTTLDALERSVEAQRHLVADASHELRTPIASLRANIQVLEEADRLPAEDLRALRKDIVEELDELTAIVADIVELARGGRRATSDSLDDVRVDLIVASVAERAARRSGGDVEFALDLEPTVVAGEPERINRAVTNVIDNARKWSPPGGRVEVNLADGTLTVRDHGPGFEEHDLPHVFERFYRSEKARSMPGSGLGLAIVRQAAEDAGGTAHAANATGGGGLVTVSFGAFERAQDGS